MTEQRVWILGVDHPLLDIQAVVDQKFLESYGLLNNDAMWIGDKHEGLLTDLVKNFKVTYEAGGTTSNTLKMFQWLMKTPKQCCAFIGSIGDDAEGQLFTNRLEEAEVHVNLQVWKKERTGTCCVLTNGGDRCLCTSPGASSLLTGDFRRQPESRALIEAASIYMFAVS